MLAIQTSPVAAPQPSPRAQSIIELSIERAGPKPPETHELPPTSQTTTARPPRTSSPRHSANRNDHISPARVSTKQPATAAREAHGLDLTPRASTLAGGDWEFFGGPEKKDANDARAAAEQTLNASFYSAANRPAYREQRAPPKLVPAADGGYDYTARARAGTVLLFRAHITRDGTVRFEDGANLQLAPIPLSGTFELADIRRGEKHTAEKRWFLEQTAALRERLARTANDRSATPM